MSQESINSIAESIGQEVLEIIARRRRPRGATYRLQFNHEFTFRDATRIVPYLHALGITHVYASPYLTAQPGSMHGYDVCRHDQLNPEVGNAEDYAAFVGALAEHGLRQVLDLVPNHMAASSHNPWWMDVLENGPSSQFAHYFDIDWRPVKLELAGKVLLPILGEQYGQVLESGQLQLELIDGCFRLRYSDHLLPIDPKTSQPILNYRIDDLKTELAEGSEHFLEYQSIVTALEHLPPASSTSPQQMTERQREKDVISRRLRRLMNDETKVALFLRRNVAEFNGQAGDPTSFDRLDELLREQSYRLCHWRSASDEVNYRRFFDVNGLAAIRQEAADVFERTHRLVMHLLARGDVDGVRIDHIDGLLDPARYLWRLQWAYLAELAWRVFAERQGLAPPNSSLEAAGLAIARWESSPASVNIDVDLASSAELGGDRPEIVTWSEVCPHVLLFLCDALRCPFPDRALLDLGISPDRAELQSTVAATSEDEVYKRAFGSSAELPLYVVVEKILGPDEPLPQSWPVAGTTGYDFLQLVNGLLIDQHGLREIERAYQRILSEKLSFGEVMYDCKVLILRFSMSSELHMLAHQLSSIAERQRRSRDFTLNMLRFALRETLASFSVYRTYAGPAGVSERDRRFVSQAIARAKRQNPAGAPAIFDFLREILLLENLESFNCTDRLGRELFAGQFQQVTSPVMAKGVEDTAYYVYCPLASINEVGSHPDVAPVSVETFHQENVQRQQQFADAMLATSTHDTKRSEDVRARIDILAEIPHDWRKACSRWLRLNRRHRREVDGLPAPSRGDEYLFYQTLVGFWPTVPPSDAEHAELVSRLQAYMEKATHEAKTRTSWENPNAAYDEAVRDFVARTMEQRKENVFLADFERFHESVVDWGLYTALTQTALKLLSPGVPDIYQGQELWDFSLVDPDNRRRVDYELRGKLLGELQGKCNQGPETQRELSASLALSPRDPQLKLYTTWQLLKLRRDLPQLFAEGEYVPLSVTGFAAKHVVAFARQWKSSDGSLQQIVVAVPRLLAQFAATAKSWGDTQVKLEFHGNRRLRHLFTSREFDPGGELLASELFDGFPIAVLTHCSDT